MKLINIIKDTFKICIKKARMEEVKKDQRVVQLIHLGANYVRGCVKT